MRFTNFPPIEQCGGSSSKARFINRKFEILGVSATLKLVTFLWYPPTPGFLESMGSTSPRHDFHGVIFHQKSWFPDQSTRILSLRFIVTVLHPHPKNPNSLANSGINQQPSTQLPNFPLAPTTPNHWVDRLNVSTDLPGRQSSWSEEGARNCRAMSHVLWVTLSLKANNQPIKTILETLLLKAWIFLYFRIGEWFPTQRDSSFRNFPSKHLWSWLVASWNSRGKPPKVGSIYLAKNWAFVEISSSIWPQLRLMNTDCNSVSRTLASWLS